MCLLTIVQIYFNYFLVPPQQDIPQRLGYAVGDHRIEMLETLRGNKVCNSTFELI